MASNYPDPRAHLPSSPAGGVARDPKQESDGVVEQSPRIGHVPQPSVFQQDAQQLSSPPQPQYAVQQQQHAHPQLQSHHLDGPRASPDQIAAAAAAVNAAANNLGLEMLQSATTVQQSQASPVPQQHAHPQAQGHGGGQYAIYPNTAMVPQPRPGSNGLAAKVTRLRRACDMCSTRKVKCDEAGPPCKPCRDLGTECKFERAMKRRGPPNKHAEAAKAKHPRLEPSFQPSPQQQGFAPNAQQHLAPNPHPQIQPAMSANPSNAAQALVSIAGHPIGFVLDAEAIAPWPVVSLLVDDFFTYIHPLAPFPHEPTFREQFRNREDRNPNNRDFLALLASMIGCLVASFPRSARLHLKNQQSATLFPRAITMIEKCREVALQARGPLFMAKEEVAVYDAATSYFLALAAGYTLQWKTCRRFMAETLSFVREMGYHKQQGSSNFITYRGPAFNHVLDQMGKRIFWVMFLGVRSMSQLGAPHSEIVLPPFTPSEPRPDYPAEVDDQYIQRDQIIGQPEGTVSLLTGFVKAIRIYEAMTPLVSVELSYGLAALGWSEQKEILFNCLNEVKNVMQDMPPELYMNLDAVNLPVGLAGGGSTGVFPDAPGFAYHPPAYPASQPLTDVRRVLENNLGRRRQVQFEIQKANIYVSQLATRSHFVERYLNNRDNYRLHNGFSSGSAYSDNKDVAAAAAAVHAAAQADDHIDASMKDERELIVANLIVVLTTVQQQNMEPNGASLINKIRQVASTLLNDAPNRKGPVAQKNEEYLARFLGILTRLEKTVPANAGLGDYQGTMTTQDEDDELRNWADLREHQLRFANQGGFMNNL